MSRADRVDHGDIDFNGEAYRLFLINCCSRNNTTAIVIEAELERIVLECPIDISGIYCAAADDQHQPANNDTDNLPVGSAASLVYSRIFSAQ